MCNFVCCNFAASLWSRMILRVRKPRKLRRLRIKTRRSRRNRSGGWWTPQRSLHAGMLKWFSVLVFHSWILKTKVKEIMHTFSTVLNTSLRGPPLPQRMAKKDGRPNREGMSQTEFQRKENLFSCIQTFCDLFCSDPLWYLSHSNFQHNSRNLYKRG